LITTGNSTSHRISADYTPRHGASFQSSHTQLNSTAFTATPR
jgi:hypothetical protein